jgi:hypothetical protein
VCLVIIASDLVRAEEILVHKFSLSMSTSSHLRENFGHDAQHDKQQ